MFITCSYVVTATPTTKLVELVVSITELLTALAQRWPKPIKLAVALNGQQFDFTKPTITRITIIITTIIVMTVMLSFVVATTKVTNVTM